MKFTTRHQLNTPLGAQTLYLVWQCRRFPLKLQDGFSSLPRFPNRSDRMTNVASIQQARDRVLQMARQIEELSQTAAPPETFFPEFLRVLVGSMGARAGANWLGGA